MDMKQKKSAGTPKPKVFQSVKGMRDVLPEEQYLWEKFKKSFKEITDFYNFLPITTPYLEDADLFNRATGETSDIVEKEMFIVKTKGGDTLALRPEGTAGVVRAYIEHGMAQQPHPLKLSYVGPFFRYQKPQSGRLRQFHQGGLEIFSHENDAIYDAQIILAAYRIIEDLRIKNLIIHVNSVGCRTCRPNYRKQLTAYYKPKEKLLCGDCKRRLATNPLRLLDCKNPGCEELKEAAPIALDSLCTQCKTHFKKLLEYLENLKLPYALNNNLVRGLDYYTKTVFEIFTERGEGEEELGFALAGGGRYDYLVEQMGGKPTAAVGVGIGAESVMTVIKKRAIVLPTRAKEKVFLIHIGDMAKQKSLVLIESLREAGINIAESLGKESLSAQLRVADKMNSPLALIFGQKEAHEESVIIRDMKTGAQETVPLAKVADMIKRRLG
jgi:histidyl-tRNA synthetase